MEYGNLVIGLGGITCVGVGIGLGIVFAYVLKRHNTSQLEEEVRQRIERDLAEAERSERLDLLQEKDSWYKFKAQQEAELEDRLNGFNKKEKEFSRKDREHHNSRQELQKESSRMKNREKMVANKERTVDQKEGELTHSIDDYREKLELVANLTSEEAREELLTHVAGEVKARSAAMIRGERLRANEEADREAKKIIAQAIQRCAVDETVQLSTASVALPNESIKSRIIGKEGRNVRAFETATGVKVVVDDTPDTVLLSAFDPKKREVGVLAMKRLINDGGFTPGHIEQVVADCQGKLEADLVKEGKRALEEIKAVDYHSELPHYVGMMKYRTTYGQNLLHHSLEVAKLAAVMAAELSLDVKLAMRAGLLHDVGKTLSREMEGSHIELGVDLGERFNEHPVVREVIAEHHEHHERQSSICFLVRAADTISSTRPGGRREDLEGYAQRIMRLEEIANSFEGVRDVYVINAGREIRTMVIGDRISDEDAEMLAFEIAERVKNEVTFPGEVKVMVVRETRSVRYSGGRRSRRNQNSNRRSRIRRPKSAVPAR